jgi:hypothetical protein
MSNKQAYLDKKKYLAQLIKDKEERAKQQEERVKQEEAKKTQSKASENLIKNMIAKVSVETTHLPEDLVHKKPEESKVVAGKLPELKISSYVVECDIQPPKKKESYDRWVQCEIIDTETIK